MQFLFSVIDEHSNSGTAEEMAAIDVFNERLRAHGHWVFAGGLESPAEATVIDNRGEALKHTQGPVNRAREFASGFWIIKANDHDAAIELAIEASKACNRKIEVRPLMEHAPQV